jgi:hypothetical protein
MIIFKTFVRPKLEYGAALLSVMERNLFREVPFVLEEIEEIEKEAMIWIIGCKKYCSPMRAVLDIPLPKHRFFTLSIQLRQQLLDLPEDNPLLHTYNYLKTVMWLTNNGTSVIMGLLKRPDIGYAEYKIPPEHPVKDHITDSQLKQYHINMYKLPAKNGHAIMSNLIIPSARSRCLRGAGHDLVLKHPYVKTRKMAILYCINKCFVHNHRCPRCHEMFNRGHLVRCKVTTEMLTNKPVIMKVWENHKQSRAFTVSTSYNYLDAAINIHCWKVVHQVLETLQFILHKQYSSARQLTQKQLRGKYSTLLPQVT